MARFFCVQEFANLNKMPSRATSGFLLEATYSFYWFGYGSYYLDYKMDKLNRKPFFLMQDLALQLPNLSQRVKK